MNLAFQNLINGQGNKTPPIWMMRQAGRYHSHYQNLRKKHSFEELCKVPELAAEVAMGPILDFDFDIAILFSDILFILEALGLSLKYTDSGPKLEKWSIDFRKNKPFDLQSAAQHLSFQKQAMQLTRQRLSDNKSLIGFVGAPWTLFVYAITGGHHGSLYPAKWDLNSYQLFLEDIIPLLKLNIKSQLEGGAEQIMLFDTSVGEIPPYLFNELILPHLTDLVETFPRKLMYYGKYTTYDHYDFPFFKNPHLTGLGIDYRFDLKSLFLKRGQYFEKNLIINGNMDPNLLTLEPSDFRLALKKYLDPLKGLTAEQRKFWIMGLGHGVIPQAKEENVRYTVNYLREMFL